MFRLATPQTFTSGKKTTAVLSHPSRYFLAFYVLLECIPGNVLDWSTMLRAFLRAHFRKIVKRFVAFWIWAYYRRLSKSSCQVNLWMLGIFHSTVNTIKEKKSEQNHHLGRGGSREGDWGDRPSKTYESKYIHHDFEQFAKQHSHLRPFCRPLFCHSSVVKYISSLSVMQSKP